jgi:hypothetical protein
LADPIGAAHSIYQQFNIPMTPAAATRIQAFVADTPQHAHGEHRHALSDFSLTEEQVDRQMADYIAFSGRFFR